MQDTRRETPVAKKVALGVAALGCVLVLVAAFLVIDASVSDEQRDATQTAIADQVDALADQAEEQRGLGGRKRTGVAGLALAARELASGVFRQAPITLSTVLPTKAGDWQSDPFEMAHAEALMGQSWTPSVLYEGDIHSIMSDLQEADGRRDLGAVRTYRLGEATAIVKIVAELDTFRTMNRTKGTDLLTAASFPKNEMFGTVDGQALRLHTRKLTTADFKDVNAPFRIITWDIGKVYFVSVYTDAGHADVLSLLSAIDLPALEDVLIDPVARPYIAQGTNLAPSLPSLLPEVARTAASPIASALELAPPDGAPASSGELESQPVSAEVVAPAPKRATCRQEGARKVCRFE